MMPDTPVHILMILDGWGATDQKEGNAVLAASTPFLDMLLEKAPHCKLACSGPAVGLPEGVMGNSEVGHMNIGSGRRVLQDLVRINTAIEDGSFFENEVLCEAMDYAVQRGSSVHFMGLVSDGGVHSHIDHLFALMDLAKKRKVPEVFVHAILDGRDTSPGSGVSYLEQVKSRIKANGYGKIASLVGRFWAMDRDTRWERIQRAYDLFTKGKGIRAEDAQEAVRNAYENDQTDEFIEPVFMENSLDGTDVPTRDGTIQDDDVVVFFNFRADRAKEITRAFTETDFPGFFREKPPAIARFVCMSQYDEDFDMPVAFGPQHLENILGQVFSENHIAQLRIAETEKYAHVTYFFNGGEETVFPGEDRKLIPSPREVTTYDEKPEMSAFEVADEACKAIESGQYQFLVLNFANMDMVGHTGNFDAAVKACEAVDSCVEKIVRTIWNTKGTAFITADHGNCEQMLGDDGSVQTSHSVNPVHFIIARRDLAPLQVRDGILGDIAPTILKFLDIQIPDEMTGTPLFQ